MVVVGAALLTTLGAYVLSRFVLLGIPHVVDEAAYLWQAQLITEGHLTITLPPQVAEMTGVQYVADVNGRRMSAFFPGSALPLALGHWVGATALINPLLAGLLVLVTYWSGRRLFDKRTAICGAALFAVSPFLLFQGAGYFSHVWTALLVVPAVTMALNERRRWEPVLVGALVGCALFSRPVSALAAAAVVGTVWLVPGRYLSKVDRAVSQWAGVRRVALAIGGGVAPLVAFLAYNDSLAGQWWRTPHRRLLPDETASFGLHAVKNIGINLAGLSVDLTGLVLVSVAVLGLALSRRSPVVLTVIGYAVIQLIAYSVYYNNGVSYGPRYLFEPAALLVLVIANEITSSKRLEGRALHVITVAAALAIGGVLPGRVAVFHSRAEYLDLSAVERQIDRTPALVFVTAGRYQFPDTFYPAFVANGPDPAKRAVTYVRDVAGQRCRSMAAFPGRTAYLAQPEGLDSAGSETAGSGGQDRDSPASKPFQMELNRCDTAYKP